MTDRAVFLDRDNTVMEDPGYISDPDAVKLLPGVELALKSLKQAGYKLVVVTNQSGVARGLLTEDAVEKIHAELRRQLGGHTVHVDQIYYCPYHPEGTVEQYARESELRKPQPGMLFKAAEELGVDLAKSWMVGDSGRDMEAGQRAGCRTVRIRLRGEGDSDEARPGNEDVQADFNARNLVDAAKLIVREDVRQPSQAAQVSGAETKPEPPVAGKPRPQKVSAVGAAAVAAQLVAPLALVGAIWNLLSGAQSLQAVVWALLALTLQVMALTFFVTRRPR
ncbi:MAG: D-glycero-alpha-D-manno-heptose-1,7-bisphosphate 7-phosphatase [Planctomycetota bacterium]